MHFIYAIQVNHLNMQLLDGASELATSAKEKPKNQEVRVSCPRITR